MTIASFEDLDSWKAARELARAVYTQTKKREFSRDFALKDQIRRAVVSIVSNLAEGFERVSNLEKLRFYGFAKASAGEVRAQLYIALDQEYLSQQDFGEMKLLVVKVANLTAGMIRYLKSKETDRLPAQANQSPANGKSPAQKNIQHSTFHIQQKRQENNNARH